jgi:DNA-binding FadR family transcriptional regulator
MVDTLARARYPQRERSAAARGGQQRHAVSISALAVDKRLTPARNWSNQLIGPMLAHGRTTPRLAAPPGRASAVDGCANALRASILAGELVAGARLPPERQLAATFGVHRATVRSALARLSAGGLVRARQGSGYQVLDYRRAGGADLLRDLVELAAGRKLVSAAHDLLLVRRQLARAVLERLVEAADGKARERIEARVEAFAATVAGGAPVATIAAADLDVIAAVLRATESPVLELCMNPIAALVVGVPRLREAIYADARVSVVGWRGLLHWLADPSLDTIDALMSAMEARDEQTIARLRAPAHRRARKGRTR